MVDVRPQGRKSTPLPFEAVWVPLEAIREGRHGLPKDRPLLLVCERGPISQVAAYYLESEGYPQVYHLEGGLLALTEGGKAP